MRKSLLSLTIGSFIMAGGLAYAQRGGDAPTREEKPEAREREGERESRGPRDGEGRPKGPRDGEGERPRGPRDGERPGPPPNPFMMALDADKDGMLSAEEIANAAVALKKLDRNQDGKLAGDEIHPPRPPREGDRRPGETREGGRRPEGDRPTREGGER